MEKNMLSKGFVTLADFYLAYRKAKSDAFYDNLHPSAIAFTEFELNLQENLECLKNEFLNEDYLWRYDLEFIGGYLYAPKSINDSVWHQNNNVHFRAIDPIKDWLQKFEANNKKCLKVKYRLIIESTVKYKIISALWILKVGHRYEEKLDKQLSYGNRLRRFRPGVFSDQRKNGELNTDSLGLFAPYFSAYQSWRENGLKAMKEAVENEDDITAITMDLAGFYHNVGPRFALRNSFLKIIDLELSNDEALFTSMLLDSIDTWYESTPDNNERTEGALPVGLSASKVLSNILLYQLDREVNKGLNPLYYGRYVDDIFLVIKTPKNIKSGGELLQHLSRSVDCLKIKRQKNKDAELKISFKYANDSNLYFTADKQKIFSLSSKHGLDLIDQISSQIRIQSSEYRLLPHVPETSTDMASYALLAAPDATLEADALRKADVISVKRLGFSLLVRDIESYSRDLARKEWKEIRTEFYGLVDRHLLTPKGIFEFSGYYSRIFKLMVSNYDFVHAHEFLLKLSYCFDIVEQTTQKTTANDVCFESCVSYFEKMLLQAALQASTSKKYTKWKLLGKLLRKLFKLNGKYKRVASDKSLKIISRDLLMADWGSRPYKDYWYYDQKTDIKDVSFPSQHSIQKIIRLTDIRKFRKSAELRVPHWPALAFPTRPLTIQEIAIVAPEVLRNEELFKASIKGLRGAGVIGSESIGFSNIDSVQYLHVPNKKKDKIHVALTNIETTKRQWEGAATGKPDRSLARYKNLCSLINRMIQEKIDLDYVVFPECSIPRRWAFSFAEKLAKQGISFMCGLEYYTYNKRKNILRNDSLISLTTRWPGYASNLIFIQPKLKPSHKEKSELRKLGKTQHNPTITTSTLPIYNHGGFYFGLLICSDLTTIDNRLHFQGKVDSLFILEWNPDVKTFSFLIEGSAHDIHTFVVQVNNRMYGDSRIRVPYREDFKRDSVRLKGGVSDYFVIGEIDYLELRKFQRRNHMSGNGVFKPVPIGFKMSHMRKRIK